MLIYMQFQTSRVRGQLPHEKHKKQLETKLLVIKSSVVVQIMKLLILTGCGAHMEPQHLGVDTGGSGMQGYVQLHETLPQTPTTKRERLCNLCASISFH